MSSGCSFLRYLTVSIQCFLFEFHYCDNNNIFGLFLKKERKIEKWWNVHCGTMAQTLAIHTSILMLDWCKCRSYGVCVMTPWACFDNCLIMASMWSSGLSVFKGLLTLNRMPPTNPELLIYNLVYFMDLCHNNKLPGQEDSSVDLSEYWRGRGKWIFFNIHHHIS